MFLLQYIRNLGCLPTLHIAWAFANIYESFVINYFRNDADEPGDATRSLVYTLADSDFISTAVVNISIIPTNDPPVINNPVVSGIFVMLVKLHVSILIYLVHDNL